MENTSWNLENFVDSLVIELDKTRETLAVKAINKPLTYTVKDMAMDLNIFPTYDGDQIKFITAQPGQQGASKVTLQLGSITDQQVRATSKTLRKDDITISDLDVNPETKKQLRKMGVTSMDDLEQIEKKNVDINKVAGKNIDYSKLINQLRKVKRNASPPEVKSVSLAMDVEKNPCLYVRGKNLAVNDQFKPVAVFNDALADVTKHNNSEIEIRLSRDQIIGAINDLVLTLDPYAIVKLNVNA